MLATPIENGTSVPMADKNNIINVRDGESLYQICIKLRRRLSGVPGFQPYLEEMEEREAEGADPVSSLWQCFRSGLPLLTIYNASEPEGGELIVDTKRPERVGKEAAFLFIKACMQQMKIPAADTFTVTELYSDNTTGFVKVTKLVNRVLDLLKLSGKLHVSSDSEASGEGTEVTPGGTKRKLTRREHILRELVDTERHYVHHLQNLQAMKKELEEVGALTGDAIHNIFLNLNNLLDFAQRFLIRIEQQHELPEEQQDWGSLFIRYQEPFKQYEPFIANQRRCEATCTKEWDKMVATARSTLTEQMLANPTILNGFLLKPFQRLSKYPLLLRDLEKQTESPELKSNLNTAIDIIQDVLHQADASIDKETREDALQDLSERVEDWKHLALSSMGELLLLGTFMVMKDGAIRSEEKEYHIYLFSRILIMCKDVNPSKQRKKGLRATSIRGKPMMHIKGRIYFTNVTQAQPMSAPGNYSLQIQWKGEKNDPNNEMFLIKFKNDETLKKWLQMIQTQRSASLLEKGNSMKTHLISMSNVEIPNPYANHNDDEEDYSRLSSTTYGDSEMSMSRNTSATSLAARSRSATNSSNVQGGRLRMPMGDFAGLPQLNTKIGAQSPGQFAGNSYFSPVDRDSPPQSASTRSSSQSAFAVYNRGVAPMSNGPESYRNTAPAMGRNNAHPSGNPYLTNGRGPSRPSLPPGTVQSANMSRMRSASSPDINPNIQQARKYPSGENIPNVPPIPAHMSKQMAPPNRSQSNSPNTVIPNRTMSSQQNDYVGHKALNGGTFYMEPKGLHVSGHHLTTDHALSPPISTPSSEESAYMPSQLRAKVRFNDNYVSMIIPSNIQFRSLTDRIDAKLSRFTAHSIASGSVRLRYQDEDGDYIWIDSDEAVQDALLDWKEQNLDKATDGQHAELLLFAHSIHGDHV